MKNRLLVSVLVSLLAIVLFAGYVIVKKPARGQKRPVETTELSQVSTPEVPNQSALGTRTRAELVPLQHVDPSAQRAAELKNIQLIQRSAAIVNESIKEILAAARPDSSATVPTNPIAFNTGPVPESGTTAVAIDQGQTAPVEPNGSAVQPVQVAALTTNLSPGSNPPPKASVGTTTQASTAVEIKVELQPVAPATVNTQVATQPTETKPAVEVKVSETPAVTSNRPAIAAISSASSSEVPPSTTVSATSATTSVAAANSSAGTKPEPVKPKVLEDGFLRLPGGDFAMGDANGLKYDKPVHTVTVGPFAISPRELTVQEWVDVMGKLPGNLKAAGNVSASFVTWYEAVEFCNELSLNRGLDPVYTIDGTNVQWDRTANGYRLPTEAEWEYAARAGGTTRYAGSANAASVAIFKSDGPHQPGTLAPNAFGLYDMSGNVAEWCWDWWAAYDVTLVNNPIGPGSGTERVARGGSWYGIERSVAVGARASYKPNDRQSSLGIRLVRNSP